VRNPIQRPSLSIIVPARNEAGMIQKIIDEICALECVTELIFVEGHSKDGTYAAIEAAVTKYSGPKKILFTQQDGKGKGDAVRKGFDMASGDIITIFDADMTVPAADMPKFYRAIVENRGDFINGSRLIYPLEKQSMRFINFLGNKFFSLAFSWLLNSRLKDTLCGTKMLWKEDYVRIQEGRAFFGDFDPFGDFDLLFGASKLNRKIVDMPVHYGERTYGTTNIQRWRHGWLLLKMVVFAMRKIKFI
jgi:glycosyltransferase involved in cell wall biosynthesis